MTSRQLWSKEEDDALLNAVQQHGPRQWVFIASMVPGRTGKQCRERWHHHVNPDIIKGKWTKEEDANILHLVGKIGRRWAVIARSMPGRTDNSVKNRFESVLKHLPDADVIAEQAPAIHTTSHTAAPILTSPFPVRSVPPKKEERGVMDSPGFNMQPRERHNTTVSTSSESDDEQGNGHTSMPSSPSFNREDDKSTSLEEDRRKRAKSDPFLNERDIEQSMDLLWQAAMKVNAQQSLILLS